MSVPQKRSQTASGSRKKSKSGIASQQYFPSDEEDEVSGSGAGQEYVRTWGLRPVGRGRYGGKRKTTQVTETRPRSLSLTAPTLSDSEQDPSAAGGAKEVVVELPDLLSSKKRKRKQRNDSVRYLTLL